MGIDALDIMHRVEEAFGFTLAREEMDFIYGTDKPLKQQVEATAGDIHDRICQLLRARQMEVPQDSWDRVKKSIAEGIGRKGFFGKRLEVSDVKQESRIVTDLGCG